MTIKIGIVGLGRSGQRFLAALSTLERANISVACAADRDNKRLAGVRDGGIELYDDFRPMLLTKSFDVLIIATNDSEHFAIFEFICRHRISLKKIICEKPVVTKPEEIGFLRSNFASDLIAVHFVERYSPAVERLAEYIAANERAVRHVEFDWSKYRIKDPRPTIGVLSEVTHPIDLALFLSKTRAETSYRIPSAWCQLSDFHVGGLIRPSSLFIALEFANGLSVAGSSSYTRSRRRRTLEIILGNRQGSATELAVLNFDNPEWDDDELLIYDIGAGARAFPPVVDHFHQGAHHLGPRRNISKICTFLEAVLADLDSHDESGTASLRHGLYVQEIVADAFETASHGQLSSTFQERKGGDFVGKEHDFVRAEASL